MHIEKTMYVVRACLLVIQILIFCDPGLHILQVHLAFEGCKHRPN